MQLSELTVSPGATIRLESGPLCSENAAQCGVSVLIVEKANQTVIIIHVIAIKRGVHLLEPPYRGSSASSLMTRRNAEITESGQRERVLLYFFCPSFAL